MSRLGLEVKKIRIKKGLTPKALAKKAGVSESFLLEVEDGRKILNDNLVNRLSKILGVNLNENGDFYASVKEETEKRKSAAASVSGATARIAAAAERQGHTPAVSPAPQWEQAFSAVIKDVPVYDPDLSKVLFQKKLVIQDNKVEGIPMEKAFFIRIEDADMDMPKFKKGDLILVHKSGDIQNAGVYVIHYRDRVRISEVKPLSGNLYLLGNRGTLAAETASSKDIKVIGKCIRAEITL
jgi:transcriptional regulator with XRE-family HTH domain